MFYTDVRLLLNDAEYWLSIPSEDNVTSKTIEEEEDYDDQQSNDITVVWETAVRPLTDVQRLIFLVFTLLVVVFAVVGNILVLYVNISRFVETIFEVTTTTTIK